jgi:hypothetical protein
MAYPSSHGTSDTPAIAPEVPTFHSGAPQMLTWRASGNKTELTKRRGNRETAMPRSRPCSDIHVQNPMGRVPESALAVAA